MLRCLLRLTISVANHAQGRAATSCTKGEEVFLQPLGMDHFDVGVLIFLHPKLNGWYCFVQK